MLVSVIIPNYNHALYLKERIDSVLNQTYCDFEVIIMDDCSTDNSRDIIEQYRGHEKVRLIAYNETNSGSTFAQWNKGVSLAKGDLIWIAESDDTCSMDLLKELVSKFMGDTSLVLAYCQSNRMNSEGLITGTWLNHTKLLENSDIFSGDFEMSGREYIEQFLIYRNTIPNASAVVFKKDSFLKIDGADETIKYCSDWFTWIKVLLEGKISYSHKCLNNFRYHNKSVISSATNKKLFLRKFDIILRKKLNSFIVSKKNKKLDLIIQKNKKLLKQDISDEGWFFRRQRKYALAFYYYALRLLH